MKQRKNVEYIIFDCCFPLQIRDVLDVLLNKGVLNKTTDKDCLVKYAPMEVADSMDATELRNNYDNGNLNVTKLTQTQVNCVI